MRNNREGVWPGRLRRIFFGVFVALFAVLFFQVVFFNPHYPYYKPLAVLALALMWLAAVWGLWRLTERFAAVLQRRERLLLLAFLILEAATMVFFYSGIAAYPNQDFERVFSSAVNFTVNGFIEEPYLTYFSRFPNNMPLTILLELYFRVFHRLGYSDFFILGAVFNAACLLLGYLFVYLCCKRLFGVQRGFFALALLYLCLPLQCYISIFYTDTTTLWCAPFALHCYLRLRAAQSRRGRLLAVVALGVGTAFGAALKYSAALTLLAVGVDMLLRLEWKRLLVTALVFLAAFAVFNSFYNWQTYAHFLDEETAREMRTPFSAWIMMGLSGDGSHSAADNYLVWNQETYEAMDAVARAELWRRLTGFTPGSFAAFMNSKALKSWGGGNLAVPTSVAATPIRETALAAAATSGTWLDYIMQGYHVMLFSLLAFGAAMMARRRQYTAFVPYLAVFGLFLFLLLWESGNRYLVQYIGMFMVAAGGAVDMLPARLWLRKGKEHANG